ncbi:NADH-quinone oxidoreductase subunit H [Desulfovibrio sp. OttesenSCG-928-G15]|nr:NADH-quinone oxidoreductase subunit H [Desulfovibrio sp. OttesenSCG-928-G15]
MDMLLSLTSVLVACALAPLLSGIINRVKACVAGRQGRPILQLYYDLAKLLRKAPVYSVTTTWFFRAAGPAGVAVGIGALLLMPFGPITSVVSFSGDFILLAGFFVLARFALILGALDTGSAFEGMGAAREALFSALAEPLFLLCLLLLSYHRQSMDLDGMFNVPVIASCTTDWPFYLMLALAFFLLLLMENSRIPVDDPNTHLELTMIHEVMILDHSGPDLALLEYAASLKLWVFSLLVSSALLPALAAILCAAGIVTGGKSEVAPLANVLLLLLLTGLCAVMVGFMESLMARFRMERVPQVLTVAGCCICLSAMLVWR